MNIKLKMEELEKGIGDRDIVRRVGGQI